MTDSQAPIWNTWPIFPILSLIIFWTVLGLMMWGALTRSRVCNFQFLPGITSTALLRSEIHRTHEYVLLSLFLRLPQPGGPGSCIYFPQEQGSPVIHPGMLLNVGELLLKYMALWPRVLCSLVFNIILKHKYIIVFLSSALCHVDVWCTGGLVPPFLDLGGEWFHFTSDTRWGWYWGNPRANLTPTDEEKNPLLQLQPVIQLVVVSKPTELSWLPHSY
jgi:hypothetical protein